MPSRPSNEHGRVASTDASADERALYDHTSDDGDYDGRPSGDFTDGDRDILESEDEREKLLTRQEGRSALFGRKGSGVKIGKLSKKVEMKERKKGGEGESSALMYEMEEGIGASSPSLRSRRSSESDEQRLLAIRSQRKACLTCTLIDAADAVYRHEPVVYGGGYAYT